MVRVWFAPKVGLYHGERTDIAVGILAATAVREPDDWYGIVYGVATHGSRDRALTGGVGFGFVEGRLSGSPSFMVGGETRISRRVKLMSENYILPGNTSLVSAGPRFFGEHLSADLGLVMPISGQEVWIFPLVNFVWSW